jgi:DNA-binding protein HU-beta
MNKSDLVNEVAKIVTTQKKAQTAVTSIFSTIVKALKKKDSVSLAGFGTFKVDKRKARKGRNSQTGEEIKINAKMVPKFVPGKALKDALK